MDANIAEKMTSIFCPPCREIFNDTYWVLLEQNIQTPVFLPETQSPKNFLNGLTLGCYICKRNWRIMHEESKRLLLRWFTLETTTATKVDFEMRFVYRIPSNQDSYAMWVVWNVDERQYGRTYWLHKSNAPALASQRTDLKSSTSSITSLDIAKTWLLECDSNHNRCRIDQIDDKFIPSRLLDVGRKHATEVKLRSMTVATRSCKEYIALSYVWGNLKTLQLTSNTLDKLRKGVQVSELPRTFRESILVAHHLSVRYLWIDSLCIIQDDELDWRYESLNMHKIYSNAYCVIAPTAASNPDGGLFRTRDIADLEYGTIHNPQSTGTGFHHVSVNIVEQDGWNGQLQDSPLFQRAWTVQERFLARRTLFFTDHQILYQCNSTRRCEIFPEEIPQVYQESFEPNSGCLTSPEAIIELRERGTLAEYFVKNWEKMVFSYSQCSLTYPKDKLVAFAGIAKLFEHLSGDTYVAGLWRSSIIDCLLWSPFSYQGQRPITYRAPTWSWASIDGPIQTHIRPKMYEENVVVLTKVISVQVSTQDKQPFSEVIGGNLVLNGPSTLHNCNEIDEQEQEKEHGQHFTHFCPEMKIKIRFDTEGDYQQRREPLFLLFLRAGTMKPRYDKPPGIKIVQGLTLRQVPGNVDQYTRVGWVSSKDWVDADLGNFGFQVKNDRVVLKRNTLLYTFNII